MGVHGLTTYLRENRRALSKTISLSLAETSDLQPELLIVVDGWSFIYALYLDSGLPWVYGGQNPEFAAIIVETVNAWKSVGILPHFVFDGPAPSVKFATKIDRINKQRINSSLIFYRTSAAGRSAPGFLSNRDVRMLPPLVHATCIRTLLDAGVACHFADGEGDSFAVELAGALNAFVVGNDSDFVILRPSGDGYRGYIPLADMAFTYPETPQEDENMDSDFVQKKTKRSKRKNTLHSRIGLVPQAGFDGLSFTVFTPDDFAAQLKISSALLPVVAAFAGCDFASFDKLFFDHKVTPAGRITRVAQVLQPLVTPSYTAARRTRLPSSVPDLVSAMITGLLVRPVESDEQEVMCKAIIEAIVQYNCACIFDEPDSLWPTPDCMLHHPSDCRLLQTLHGTGRNAEQKATMRHYLRAYRRGAIAPEVLDVLVSGTYWPTMFLENPDWEASAKHIGRPLRQFMYAVLHHDVGIVDPDIKPTDQYKAVESGVLLDAPSTESGMSSVLEEDVFDPSACPPSPTDSVASSFVQPTASEVLSVDAALAIKEYVRRGGHIGAQDVPVPALHDILVGFQLTPEPDQPDAVYARSRPVRLRMFLHALRSDTQLVRSLDESLVLPVAVLRWVIQVMGARASPSERWQRGEVLAVLAALLTNETPSTVPPEPVPADPRNVQLTAQLLSAYESGLHLGQTLFLPDLVGNSVTRFAGQRIHTYLAHRLGANVVEASVSDSFAASAAAVLDGIENQLSGERAASRRVKQGKSTPAQTPPASRRGVSGGSKQQAPRRSMFDVLADLKDYSPSKRRIETDVMKLLMSDYEVSLVEDSMQEFHVRFFGPAETPFVGGEWTIHVELPDQYPYKSPSIGFLNKIYHPNIDELSGSVCLDVINQTWSPMFDMINIFEVFLPQLLRYPNPNDPLNGEAAALLMRHPQEYEAKVKDHVKRFATKEAADAAAGHKTGKADDEDEEMDEMSDAGSYSDGVDLDP